MKKAEDIAYNIKPIQGSPDGKGLYFTYEEVVKAVRKAQIEAIDYTVKRCAEEASLQAYREGYSGEELDLIDIEPDIESGHHYGSEEHIKVNKQSILNVADKIKEEL